MSEFTRTLIVDSELGANNPPYYYKYIKDAVIALTPPNGNGELELSGEQKKQLNIALRSAFTKSGLEILLDHELDKNLDDYAQGTLRETVFMIIKGAIMEGWIVKLIDAAIKSNPESPKLKTFVQELKIYSN